MTNHLISTEGEPIKFERPARLGIIAGSDLYPILLSQKAIQCGTEIVAIGFPGITSPEIQSVIPNIHWIQFGQIEPIIKIFLTKGIQKAIFSGKISQSVIFQPEQLDSSAKNILTKLSNQQPDSLLGALANIFQNFGITFLDARTFLDAHLAESGLMTERPPSDSELQDIKYGYKIAKHIAAEDIGQTVVIKQLAILAVEAIEGTDETIERAVRYGGPGSVIVKVSKPKQDFRFDIPVIGLDTIKIMSKYAIKVIGLDTDKTLMLNKPLVIKSANDANITIYGIPE